MLTCKTRYLNKQISLNVIQVRQDFHLEIKNKEIWILNLCFLFSLFRLKSKKNNIQYKQ